MNRRIFLAGTILMSSLATISAQSEKDRAEIVKSYNLPLLKKMAEESALKAKAEKAHAIEFAKLNNIPIIIDHRDGSKSELIRIENGVPIYYTNNNVAAAKSTRANFLNPGGALGLNLRGENINVGVWDQGAVRTTHQEMAGRVSIGDNASATGDSHATHVGGTIAATGVQANAKGMAPLAKIKSYEWNNDASEMISAASEGLLISNHSYGYRADQLPDWYFGAYIDVSAQWDNILFNAPYYVVCKAAGNDGASTANASPIGGSSSAFDKLSGGSTSKNVLIVANANDAVIDSNGNLTSVSINGSSSQGPTDDLRIKPDITGNGTGVYSPVSSSDAAYATYTGTSMASPNVAGTLVLVNNHFKNVTGQFMLGAALRGLAMHTADDAGSNGPDVNFGWGLLNAKKMAETINNRNTTAIISDLSLSNGSTYTLEVNSDGINPLSASISWYDRAGTVQTSTQMNSTTKRLVNDLDLRIVNNSGNTFLPWALTSRSSNAKQDNTADNFERVDAGVVPAGKYTLTVSHKGSLAGGSQNYTLIVTGKSSGNTTPATCNAPTNLVANNITASGSEITWTASSSANTGYSVEYKTAAATNWTSATSVSGNSTVLSGLSTNTDYNVRIRTNCTSTLASAYANVNFKTIAATTCSAPTSLASSNITASSASVNWAASTTSNVGYTVEYKTQASSTWIVAGTTSNTNYVLSNLSSSTVYNWRVKTNCASSSDSDYGAANFTTSAASTTSCADAFENNNTIASAYSINPNNVYQAAIGTAGDVDYYKVVLPNGQYTAKLSNLTHDIDLKIQNAAGSTLATSQQSGNNDEQITATFNGGTYYFRVYPYSGYNANSCYQFSISNASGNAVFSTGASAIDDGTMIKVYPNPARNEIRVKISQKGKSESTISIYDMTGKEMMTTKGVDGENKIDISRLVSGTYIITYNDGAETVTTKFIKL